MHTICSSSANRKFELADIATKISYISYRRHNCDEYKFEKSISNENNLDFDNLDNNWTTQLISRSSNGFWSFSRGKLIKLLLLL